MTLKKKKGTATSQFGSGKRESHDSSDFYARFKAPEVSSDEQVQTCPIKDTLIHGDSRTMQSIPDNCIALMVTSPPYFAGKEYETALGEGHIPGSYIEYLAMLKDVFAECKRVLEPGGRMAINIANLGRKPYRSLAADVTRILQDDLHLLLRGEIIWVKGDGASGNCAWGSFASAANPCLRDLSERIIVAAKGRFDRAIPRKKRATMGLPHENTISKKRFMESTLDVWKIPPERARKIGHPAPFPPALPERLIELYTYRNDTILDPFIGSGTTAIAAARLGRRYVGYDVDEGYLKLARTRLRTETGMFRQLMPEK
jgi:DNA modification methylase